MFETVLQEFAERIGLGILSFSPQGVAAVEIRGVGTLYMEKQEERDGKTELLVYLAKKYDVYDTGFSRKLLEFCSYDKGYDPVIYGSLAGDSCILGLRFSEDRLHSAVQLENAVYFLNDKFQQLM